MYDADKIACENAHELFSKTSRVGYRISRELGKVSWAFSILMRKKDSHEKNEILMSEKPHEKFSSDFENSHEKVIFSWESHEILMRKQKLTRIFVRAMMVVWTSLYCIFFCKEQEKLVTWWTKETQTLLSDGAWSCPGLVHGRSDAFCFNFGNDVFYCLLFIGFKDLFDKLG